jgi:hypothetical protein
MLNSLDPAARPYAEFIIAFDGLNSIPALRGPDDEENIACAELFPENRSKRRLHSRISFE